MLFRIIINNEKNNKLELKTGDDLAVSGVMVPVDAVKIGDVVPQGTVTNIASFQGESWT